MPRVLIFFVAAVFLVVSTVSWLAVQRKILARGPSYEPERSHWGPSHMRIILAAYWRGSVRYADCVS